MGFLKAYCFSLPSFGDAARGAVTRAGVAPSAAQVGVSLRSVTAAGPTPRAGGQGPGRLSGCEAGMGRACGQGSGPRSLPHLSGPRPGPRRLLLLLLLPSSSSFSTAAPALLTARGRNPSEERK